MRTRVVPLPEDRPEHGSPSMPAPYLGTCLCGQIEFRLDGEPITLYACHCTDCQRRSGGALLLSMWVLRDALVVTRGAPIRVSSIANDARERVSTVCPACEVRLWAEPVDRPRHAILRPGLLHRAKDFQPVAHQFVRSALPWFVFPKDVALFETTPEDPRELVRLWQARRDVGR
jgi:hypothetical protein